MVTETAKQSSEIPISSLTQTRFAATHRVYPTFHSVYACTPNHADVLVLAFVCVCVWTVLVHNTVIVSACFWMRGSEMIWYGTLRHVLAVYIQPRRWRKEWTKKKKTILSLARIQKDIWFGVLNVTTHFLFLLIDAKERQAYEIALERREERMKQSIRLLYGQYVHMSVLCTSSRYVQFHIIVCVSWRRVLRERSNIPHTRARSHSTQH